jgi:hypothetical protein
MTCNRWCGAIAAAIALGTAGQAGAALMAGAMHEPFDYAAATQFGSNSTNNGGQGWNATGTTAPNAASANWGATGIPGAHGGAAANKTATSPGLTYAATGYKPASGNKLTLDSSPTGAASQNIGRSLGGQSIDTGSLYFSYLTEKNNDTIRTINLAFFNTPSSEKLAIGQVGATAGHTGGNIALLFNNSNPAGIVQTAGTPIPYGVGVTHLIIGRVDWNAAGNETVTLWVDPADVTTEAAAGAFYIQSGGFELAAFTTLRPFTGNANTNVGGGPVVGASADFDEIRVGGSWASVTTDAVPEPATGLLLAFGGLALAGARTKR